MPASIPIQRLALSFSLGLLATLLLVAAAAIWQFSETAEQLQHSRQQSAQHELAAALERQLRRTYAQSVELAHWSQTAEQLHVLDGLEYWASRAVPRSGKLDSAHAQVWLYHPKGHQFAFGGIHPDMPAQLPLHGAGEQTQAWLVGENGRLVLYQAFSVFSQETAIALHDMPRLAQEPQRVRVLLGHGLIRLDVVADLRPRQAFRFADLDGLALRRPEGERFAPEALFEHVAVSTLSDPVLQRFHFFSALSFVLVLLLFGAASLVAQRWFKRMLVQPLSDLVRAIETLQSDDKADGTARTQPPRIIELQAVQRSLHDYHEKNRRLHQQLHQHNQRLHSQAYLDGLTGSHNRRAFDEDWERLLAQIESRAQHLAFLLFDCNRFKTINDSYGHAVGDAVLVRIAAALRAALRGEDRLYRLGGDEFAIVLSGANQEQGLQIAQRCLHLVRTSAFTDLGIVEPVGVSIGLACCGPEDCADAQDLPRRADVAMYQAKRSGHEPIALYGAQAAPDCRALGSAHDARALLLALAAPGMIELHYQAILALPSRQTSHYEVLARIRYLGQLIAPAAFMPLVEHRRLETEFDRAVLLQLEADLATGRLPHGLGLSINLSAQSLMHPPTVERLCALARHGSLHPLMLELTETALVQQIEQTRACLEQLRRAGFRVAMDDFGTGYSPLRYLLDLPVDTIKLDLSLTRALGQDNQNGQMVRSLSRLLLDAGYALVAEGVESPTELQRAEEMGFGHAQGYLIARPLPLERLDGVCAAPERSATQPPARSSAAARSPIMIEGALVLPPMSVGMTEASATRSPCRPCTRSCASTTAPSSCPMRQVPTGW